MNPSSINPQTVQPYRPNTLSGSLKRLLLIGLGFGLIAYSSLVIVPQGQTGLIVSWGEITEVITTPGLSFKWPAPIQTIELLEQRIQTIAAPQAARLDSVDHKTLLIDGLIQWQITNPQAFYTRFHGNTTDAENFIGALVRDAMNPVLTARTAQAIMGSERDAINQALVANVQTRLQGTGTQVLDIGLIRANYLPEVNDNLLALMTVDRKKAANDQRVMGIANSDTVRAKAEEEREKIIGAAYQQAQTIKGEADATASSIYAASIGNNTEFYAFYRSLEAYRESFKTKQDVLVVDPASDFFKYFKSPKP